MSTEFNLSDEVIKNSCYADSYIYVESVKEFIRLLKDELRADKQGKYYFSESEEVIILIDKLAGDKLI